MAGHVGLCITRHARKRRHVVVGTNSKSLRTCIRVVRTYAAYAVRNPFGSCRGRGRGGGGAARATKSPGHESRGRGAPTRASVATATAAARALGDARTSLAAPSVRSLIRPNYHECSRVFVRDERFFNGDTPKTR